MSSLILMLLRLEFSAPVRLADPSRIKSEAVITCTFPGNLSMSIAFPGIAVDSTTMAGRGGLPTDTVCAAAGMDAATVLSALARTFANSAST